MYIESTLLDKIMELCKFKYGGCHAPHNETPLYGRVAYWRAYLPDGTYVCKITTPVEVLEPEPAQLQKLLRIEVKKRFKEIHELVMCDHYGKIKIVYRDPNGIKPLLKCILDKYYDQDFK